MLKFFAKALLKLGGWKVPAQAPPNTERCVLICAPHTSNWDYYYLIICFWALGVPIKVAIKEFWTKFPFGLLIRPLGGIGINRQQSPGKKRKKQVEMMAELYAQEERIALAIAPEGTRSLRKEWKIGFLHIAELAEVPIMPTFLDYGTKTAGFGDPIFNLEDKDEVMRELMSFYSQFNGRFPEKFALDERYS